MHTATREEATIKSDRRNINISAEKILPERRTKRLLLKILPKREIAKSLLQLLRDNL